MKLNLEVNSTDISITPESTAQLVQVEDNFQIS